MNINKLKIISGSANSALAEEIAHYLNIPLIQTELTRFIDGELHITINESVRGASVFVIQPTCPPVNENLMELLVTIDALKRASARRVIAVIPYYGYARQDRKTRPREPITAKLVADMMTVAGAKRVVTMDLHADQIQGFFNIPVDHLMAGPMLADYLKKKGLQDVVVASPDIGGVARARKFAEILHAPLVIVDKRRPEPNVSEVINVIGRVEGKTVVMIDDIIDTAGTITQGAKALMELGAKEVYACASHALLSGRAIERLKDSVLQEVIVTNSIPLDSEKQIKTIKQLSIAPLFGEAILRIHEDLSISKLFS